jgi:hypothetical protein
VGKGFALGVFFLLGHFAFFFVKDINVGGGTKISRQPVGARVHFTFYPRAGHVLTSRF